MASVLALKLGLPANNAIEIGEAWEIVGKILLGPEIETQVTKNK